MKIKYSFSAITWQHQGNGGWHFVSLPVDISEEIRVALRQNEEGWGRLRASARIGNSEWKTSIWFDTKMKAYLLPLKFEIRKTENIRVGQMIDVLLWV